MQVRWLLGDGVQHRHRASRVLQTRVLLLTTSRYQMAADQAAAQLQPQQRRVQAELERHQAAFAAKAQPTRLLAGLGGGGQQVQKRARVAESVVAALALEQHVPQYGVGRQWGHALGGGDGAMASRVHRPFSSLLLVPATVLEPAAAAALEASTGLGADLRWALLPGGPAGGRGAAAAAAPAPEQRQQAQQGATAAAAAEAGQRYFQGDAPPSSSTEGEAGADALWRRQYESLLQLHPEDEQLWLSYAVRHAVEAARTHGSRNAGASALTAGARRAGRAGTWQGACRPSHPCLHRAISSRCLPLPSPGVREGALLILKRGLEQNRSSAVLWPLYLHLYVQQPGGERAGPWSRA